MGKQSLYNVVISIDVKEFGESDSWSHHFGFRKIESHIDDATGGRYGDFLDFFNVTILYLLLSIINSFFKLILLSVYVLLHTSYL